MGALNLYYLLLKKESQESGYKHVVGANESILDMKHKFLSPWRKIIESRLSSKDLHSDVLSRLNLLHFTLNMVWDYCNLKD